MNDKQWLTTTESLTFHSQPPGVAVVSDYKHSNANYVALKYI